ncbi:kelch repeat and BTB domain-containing protein 12 isoform X1 [Alligator sinensis]|uniref:Kelch repeat and BTB domain-containing protein 12 isoform X1 n=1 Tax=Alligator sinensis TaxID=38654 RepID=A0A1U7RRW8_ALLSI|nr:kelch repeat and BTB domain-containing protein 12 isoform X1 [Alligator sinensis]XP_025052599.1 kelch repeat and BTB domain-containing protein 12 isoform X1 [Alligator sinensis]XP_025052600.1 kelch repeat and BTB domain-containing protein 12 isoform X1 [Alligator sinensis]XP_025052601.1 kelch repeat and BTB domain-containing protein 12 isoform X1 [Alligator sinensis]XP_025052602.1 kelch repeat and BTB domain-containing protein 12 isoform X1 [Alligator sinensis]XP_025052603.1 kelch repeat an
MDYKTDLKRRQLHSLTLLDQINGMKELTQMIDVVLVAEGEKFPCHKLILAAFSPYFKAMFTCGLLECTQREVVLYDISAESVSIILNYMYSADLHLTHLNVQNVAVAAYFLQMEDIFSTCEKYMMDHMDSSNCVGIYYFAKHIGAEDLSDQARRYLYRHFAEVSLQEEILEIEAQQLLSLIRSDDLNVSREENILDLVLRWVNHSRKSRSEHLIELLKQVRLVLVSPSFLVEARKRNTVLLCNSECHTMIEKALETIKKANQPSFSLRYGMETTSLLLCIGNNSLGIRSRHGSYADASFCYAPATKKTYFISSPKYGEGLGCVCTGVVTENNDIIVAGEASAAKMSRQKTRNIEIYRYHHRGNQSWENLCTAQFRELYALGTIHNDLYIIGGQAKLKNQYLVTNCVEKYSMEQGSWRSVAPLSLQLACHAVVTVKNKLYVMGGWTPQMDLPDDEPDRLSNRMFQYDPGQDKWTERTPMKYSKYRFSTAVVNSEIYVLGGIGCLGRDRGQARKCLDAVEIYNPDGDFWRDGPPMPSPLLALRTNSTNAGSVEGKLYLCGGFRGAARHEVITKEILELDTWENQWNVVAVNVLMHDNYDVCLVARLNPRDLIPPPSDLVEP